MTDSEFEEFRQKHRMPTLNRIVFMGKWVPWLVAYIPFAILVMAVCFVHSIWDLVAANQNVERLIAWTDEKLSEVKRDRVKLSRPRNVTSTEKERT